MSKGRFAIIEEVTEKLEDGETLCLQYGVFNYQDGSREFTYRFIRRTVEGKLRTSTAFIPDLSLVMKLYRKITDYKKP